jgi:hydrogenase-4 component E
MTAVLAVIFGLAMIYASSTSRIEAYIRALAVQGIVLFLAVISDMAQMKLGGVIFLSVETLLFKAVIIPWFLIYTVRKNGIMREDEPYIPNFYSVVITTLIFAAGFGASYALSGSGAHGEIKPLYFGASIAAMVTGLFIIITRKKIITHVMGYVMMENGIFLLSLSLAGEMPFIVNLGVLLDLFIAVFLLGLFVSKINDTFDEVKIDSLTELRD